VHNRYKRITLRTSPSDSRRFTRLDVKLAAHVSIVPDSCPDDVVWEVLRPKSAPVVVSDLSATGLYFVSQFHYELGQQIWVAIDIQGNSHPIRGIVVRQQAQFRSGKKIYGYGVQFLRSRFAARAVAAILDYLAQRISVMRDEERARLRNRLDGLWPEVAVKLGSIVSKV
jgi:hypothetical protein